MERKLVNGGRMHGTEKIRKNEMVETDVDISMTEITGTEEIVEGCFINVVNYRYSIRH